MFAGKWVGSSRNWINEYAQAQYYALRMLTIGPTIAVTVRTCSVQVTSRDFKMTELTVANYGF